MYLFIYLLAIISCLFLTTCKKKTEGCMDPRAINFNPEADAPSKTGCEYYQLELEWQHYSQNTPNDTVNVENWLKDAAGDFFYLDQCNWLGSKVHLTPVGKSVATPSFTRVLFRKNDGGGLQVEDNFFLMSLNNYSADAAAWVELGDFDQLSFQMGIDPNLQKVNPKKTLIKGHPLSSTASPYLYDSTQQHFNTLELAVIQPNNNDRRVKVNLSDVFQFNFPYTVRARDGKNVPIKIRLNYDILLSGISFTNDPVPVIETKLKRNIPTAFSVY